MPGHIASLEHESESRRKLCADVPRPSRSTALSHTSKSSGRVVVTLRASAISVLRPEGGGSVVLFSDLYLCRSTYTRYVSTSHDVARLLPLAWCCSVTCGGRALLCAFVSAQNGFNVSVIYEDSVRTAQ